MITLTIINLKTKKKGIETFASKDKAETRLQKLITNPKGLEERKKGEYLDAYSYDTEAEKALIEQFLPVTRRITGGN